MALHAPNFHASSSSLKQKQSGSIKSRGSRLASVNTQLLLRTCLQVTVGSDDSIQKRPALELQSIAMTPQLGVPIKKYLSAALADNTKLAYKGDVEDFTAWGGSIPCSAETLATYVASRATSHSPFTIARRLVGISRAHTSQGLTDPAKCDLVRTVMRGVRRTHGSAQRQATPLLKSDLMALIPLMEGCKGLRDKALTLLGFSCALRRSELVALNLEDIEYVREGLIIHLRRSKTDQTGTGRKIAVPHGRTALCPVKAVENWIAYSMAMSGPLFRSIRKNGVVSSQRLTAQSVSLILKMYASSAGLNASSVSGHSLRSGLVTSAAMAGVSIWKIKAQSGHKSDAMISRYVRDANLFTDNASGALL